jgi:hypothetical protein
MHPREANDRPSRTGNPFPPGPILIVLPSAASGIRPAPSKVTAIIPSGAIPIAPDLLSTKISGDWQRVTFRWLARWRDG